MKEISWRLFLTLSKLKLLKHLNTSRYLDDLLDIDKPYFEGMVNRIYLPELQLNKANTSDTEAPKANTSDTEAPKANTSNTEAPFLDLHLSVSNGFVSSKIYDKRVDFDFDIVNFPFLDGDVPNSTSYGNLTFLNLFVLLECRAMWLISMPVMKV